MATKLTAEERFMRFVFPEPMSGCWLWVGAEDKDGYGIFQKDRHPIKAHRYSYSIFVAPIPDNFVIRHKCDTPSCVNPDHLDCGTHKQNVKDMYDRKRNADFRGSGCGHNKLTESDVIEIKKCLENYKFGMLKILGEKFGVTNKAISEIKSGRNWGHIKI